MISARAKCIVAAVVAALAVAAGALAVVQSGAWTKWRVHRYASRAEALERSGAREAARAACLRALALDRDCLPATRTLLAVLPSENTLEAVLLRVRLADLDPSDHDNLRRLSQIALAIGRFDIAEKVAGDLARALGEVPEVLELRAHIPAARGDFPAAATAAKTLLERDSDNVVGRLILALAQVFTGTQTATTEQELTTLSTNQKVRVEALRGLRDAALRRKDEARALEMAEAIVADKRANFSDRLTRAQLASLKQPERFEALLAEVTTHAGTDPRALGRIAAWLRQSGRSERIEPWIAGNETLKRDPFTAKLIRAEALATQKEWEKLDSLLAEGNWRELEFLRLALQARAARGRQDETASAKAWRDATATALANTSTTQMLADAVRAWPDFDQEFDELLWRASTRVQNAAWALSELFRRATARKDTRALRRVSEAMCQAYPANEPAKNNLAFYALLLGALPDRANRLAEELYAAHPDDGAIASTYALSLLRRGKPGEALAVLEKLPSDVLRAPALAPYHALALSGAGMHDKAQARATEIVAGELLPEELEMLREARLQLKPLP